jgi:UDP-N-acetylmuramoylalanine--D-glutamate ligase
VRISQLESIAANGGHVALWGWGREGQAAYHAIRHRLPTLALTLFCDVGEAGQARELEDGLLAIEIDASAERLSTFSVVVKSPGISPYRPEVIAAAACGTCFVGGTELWFAENPDARMLCITGTKGKSTTTALLAHLLRSGGHRTALAGNIGLPLLELIDETAEFWAIELSSYQTGDVADSGVHPELAIALNIFPEHLDWHGSQARYVQDKLRLLTDAKPRIAILNANDPVLANLLLPDSDVRWFGGREGWHLRGDVLHRGQAEVMDTSQLPFPGRHNRINLCAVLTAIDALGLDANALAPHAATFLPLPHRLQVLGMRDGITYVNDSISTTPHASLAALELFRGQRVAILVGGHDRGLDWQAFADVVQSQSPTAIVTMGGNGPRIFDLLADTNGAFTLDAAADLADAMRIARGRLGGAGIVLLSPGAPSFGMYRDYTQRGRHFAELAGFDPQVITSITGLGIA